MSELAARITALLDGGYEAYRVHRKRPMRWPCPSGAEAPDETHSCLRCGHGQWSDTGNRRRLIVFVRRVGTMAKDARGLAIHMGCVPG